ncbi:MAG: hypothetical protein ABJB76_09450 [Candidatus Nitrosocosmicus sp.]
MVYAFLFSFIIWTAMVNNNSDVKMVPLLISSSNNGLADVNQSFKNGNRHVVMGYDRNKIAHKL